MARQASVFSVLPTTRQTRVARARSGPPARAWAGALLLAAAAALSLGGCGGGARSDGQSPAARASTAPAYAAAPYTPQQLRVERGAHLFVVDGCSACHAIGGRAGIGPSFAQFAGDHVTLADGRRGLVNERFLREALLNPRAVALAGYPLEPMLAGVRRLHFREHRADAAALAAFIEQIGPEDE
jgi:mono/diheme cytochrome c family protein